MGECEGYRNAIKAIQKFIGSDMNPTQQDYHDISGRLNRDGCNSLATHITAYIEEIGRELQDLRGEVMDISRGVLQIAITDDINKVKLNTVEGVNDYKITFPSSKISDEQLKSHRYFKYYRTSPVMELAYGPAGLNFSEVSIEDGNYHKEVYSGAIPYLLTRVTGKVTCPVGVLWGTLAHKESLK